MDLNSIANLIEPSNIVKELAKYLNQTIDFDKIKDLEIFLTIEKTYLDRIHSKCILINSSESEAFLFSSFMSFSEVILITTEEFHDVYNNFLNTLDQINIATENTYFDSSSIFYFPNKETLHRDFYKLNPFSIGITEREFCIDFYDDVLELGNYNQRFIIFYKIRKDQITESEMRCMKCINQIFLNRYFLINIKPLRSFISMYEDYFENHYSQRIQSLNITESAHLKNVKSIEKIFNYFRVEDISNCFENYSNTYNADEIDMIFDNIHRFYLNKDFSSVISYLIKYILLNFYKIIEDMKNELYNDLSNFSLKLNIFHELILYPPNRIISDCIMKFEISELIFACLDNIFSFCPQNFQCLAENISNIKYIDSNQNPTVFENVNEIMTIHIKKLLNNPNIFNGFKELDSFTIRADSMEKSIKILEEILSTPYNSVIFTINDFAITHQSDNIYYVQPINDTIERHLILAIPREFITIPSIEGKKFSFIGKTLLGGKIAIRSDLLSVNSKISKAKLILNLIHEISHKKRLIFANKNHFFPPTPVKFLKESGYFMDKIIYGEHVSGPCCSLSKFNKEIAKKILKVLPLSKDEADLIFFPVSALGRSMNDHLDDSDDNTPICEGRIVRKLNFK